MGTEDAKVNTLSIGQKATALASATLIILSLIAALYFVSISVASLLTRSISDYWKGCFLLCSTALAGWMILYAGLLRLGGGVMTFLNNMLIFWFLVFAVFVSTALRFPSPQMYIAILVLALSLAAFHIAVPGFLNPRRLVRLILRTRNKGGAGPN